MIVKFFSLWYLNTYKMEEITGEEEVLTNLIQQRLESKNVEFELSFARSRQRKLVNMREENLYYRLFQRYITHKVIEKKGKGGKKGKSEKKKKEEKKDKEEYTISFIDDGDSDLLVSRIKFDRSFNQTGKEAYTKNRLEFKVIDDFVITNSSGLKNDIIINAKLSEENPQKFDVEKILNKNFYLIRVFYRKTINISKHFKMDVSIVYNYSNPHGINFKTQEQIHDFITNYFKVVEKVRYNLERENFDEMTAMREASAISLEMEIEFDKKKTKDNAITIHEELLEILRKLGFKRYNLTGGNFSSDLTKYLVEEYFEDILKAKFQGGYEKKAITTRDIFNQVNNLDISIFSRMITEHCVLTLKVDGIRYICFIVNYTKTKQKIFLVGMDEGVKEITKKEIRDIKSEEFLVNLHKAHNSIIILDGELTEKGNYYPFDIFKDKTRNYFEDNILERVEGIKSTLSSIKKENFCVNFIVKDFLGGASDDKTGEYYKKENMKNTELIWKKTRKKIDDEVDGIIYITYHSSHVVRKGTGINSPIFKWKPAENNTFDFLAKKVEFGDDKGKFYLYCSATKQMMFINRNLFYEKGYNSRFKKGSFRYRFPILFKPDVPFDYEEEIYVFKDDGSFDIKIQDDRIYEFRFEKKRGWIPLKEREDKTSIYKSQATYFGNSYEVAYTMWLNVIYPLTMSLITGKEEIPYYLIDNSYRRKNVLKSMVKFHNFGKGVLYLRFLEGANTIIELGSGKFNDITRWMNASIKKVIAVEPDAQSLKEGREFLEIHKPKANFPEIEEHEISAQDFMSLNDSEKSKKVDGVVSQFAIHYFYDEKTFPKFIKNVLKEKGKIIITYLDGNKISEEIKKDGYISITRTGTYEPLLEISKIGDTQINFYMTSIGIANIENLFFVDEFIETMKEEKMKILQQGSFIEDFYQDYEYSLTEEEKQISSYYHYLVMEKESETPKKKRTTKKITIKEENPKKKKKTIKEKK